MQKNLRLFYAILVVPAWLVSGCSRQQAPARVIQVEMRKYTITPAEIHAKQNESVQLNVTSADTEHGFDVPDLKVSEPVKPGMPATIRLDTSQKGTHNVECGIICGAHHEEMRAKIIIE